MKQLYFCILFLSLIVGPSLTLAQPGPCAPNCKDLNASIIPGSQGGFHAKIYWSDIITNFDCAEPVTYAFQRGGGPAQGGGSSDDVGNEEYFLIEDACNFLDGGIYVIIQNDQGMCRSHITFKKGEPSIIGRTTTVYCNDSIVHYPDVYINGTPPSTFLSCIGVGPEPEFTADWIRDFPCQVDPMLNDTLKVIYRGWEIFDKHGKRAEVFDTINVLRLPAVDLLNTYCGEQDTVYCGLSDDCIGPYLIYEEDASGGMADLDGDGSFCDTIKFLEVTQGEDCLEFSGAIFDDKCGLLVEAKSWKFDSDCNPQYKVEVYIKETCTRQLATTPICIVSGAGNVLENLGDGYWRCVFWLMDLDTVPPETACKFDKIGEDRLLDQECFFPSDVANIAPEDPVIVVSTSSNDCVAHTYIPPVCVYDDWSGVKQVKARIEGVGSWILTAADSCDEVEGGICFESHQTVALHKLASGAPHEILYEVYDSCHNVDTAYCYILVKDLVKPVLTVDKGITVSVSDKKVWVDAEEFNENSSDNCGINLFLARRVDWYDEVGGCVDLCDSIDFCCVSPHEDTLWISLLEPDKHRSDTTFSDDVEAHYARNLEWWCRDSTPCGALVYNAWQYDLMKHATLKCIDHPYDVDELYFQKHFTQCYYDFRFYGPSTANGLSDVSDFHDIDPTDIVEFCFDKFKPLPTNSGCTHLNGQVATLEEIRAEVELYERLGGGWSDAVAFGCDDVCGSVRVELLAMDYWCNWSIAWADVWVEDKTPVTIAKDVLEEIEITCKTYKEQQYHYDGAEYPVSIEYLVELAKNGDPAAIDSLDALFGGYEKAWKDPYGNYIDIDGELVECDIPFSDSVCECRDTTVQFRLYDEHLGYIWKDSFYKICEYVEEPEVFQHGVAVVNCADNVHCEQDIWCEFDHCGEGYILRKFKIWQSCPDTSLTHQSGHVPDTIIRTQKIWVGNNCELDKYMFDVPTDTSIYACGVTYDPSGSGRLVGALDPDSTGYPTYKFDDDCKIVGIAHEDKVFKIVGGDAACYKVIRTFYFADWCGGKPTSDTWYHDRELVLDSCVQKILLYDTTAPVCTIDNALVEDGVISVAACNYDFIANVSVTDPCGLISYTWEIKDLDKDNLVVDQGNGELEGNNEEGFEVNSPGLSAGAYKLIVVTVDECQNEGYCELIFDVETGKKPAPVCITSLTADLVPWDIDQDGTADTSKAVIWAAEFDQSSRGPCGEEDDSLSFYIELREEGIDQSELDLDRVADSLALGCQHLGSHFVRMWVVSSSGTADFCDVILIVTNNSGLDCQSMSGDQGALSGTIETELGEIVEQVSVLAESNQALSNVASGEDGNYQFNVSMGSTVTIRPLKNLEVKNGVTTMDLVLILNHITGTEELPTAYRRLSADPNLDGFINSLDLLEFRQLILGEIDQLSSANSWRFVTKDYVFTTETPEMEKVPDQVTFNSIDQQNISQDFIGMKMGDLDLDAEPSRQAPRGANKLIFALDDQELVAGETYRVELRSHNFTNVIGYQYTLQVDPTVAEIKSVTPGQDLERMDGRNYGLTHLPDGILTSSWNTTSDGASIPDGKPVVTIEIEAKEEARLSDVLNLGSLITAAESYTAKGYGGVALSYGGIEKNTEVQLFQNQPNPVGEATRIDFYLPADDRISFEMMDASGRHLKKIEGNFSAGRHTLNFGKGELPTAQVIFYTLRTSNRMITRRMVTMK